MQEILAAIQALRDDVAKLNARLEPILKYFEPGEITAAVQCAQCGRYRPSKDGNCGTCGSSWTVDKSIGIWNDCESPGRYPIAHHQVTTADDPLTVG